MNKFLLIILCILIPSEIMAGYMYPASQTRNRLRRVHVGRTVSERILNEDNCCNCCGIACCCCGVVITSLALCPPLDMCKVNMVEGISSGSFMLLVGSSALLPAVCKLINKFKEE